MRTGQSLIRVGFGSGSGQAQGQGQGLVTVGSNEIWLISLFLKQFVASPSVSEGQMKMKSRQMFSHRSSTTLSAQGKLQKAPGPSSG